MIKIFLALIILTTSSGCWLANDFSKCNPSSCPGVCEDNICVVDSKSDTGIDDARDTGPDLGQKTACVVHTDCDQNEDLKGKELCVKGFCETMIFDEGAGACEKLSLGGEKLTVAPKDTIIVPVVTSISGDAEPVNQRRANSAFELAAKLANASGALGDRKILLVLCDDNTDAEVSKAIGKKLLDRTQAISFLGANFVGGLSTKVTPSITERKVLAFINSTDLGYAALPDDDLAFRNLPSEQLSITAIAALIDRYNPTEVAVFYPDDNAVLDTEGLSLLQLILNHSTLTGKYKHNDYNSAVATVANGTKNLGRPAEMLIAVGTPTDVQGVIGAYRQSFGEEFSENPPRILVPTVAAFSISKILQLDPVLTPNRVEMTTGAANTTEAFRTLFTTEFGFFDEVAPSLFDSAMLVFLAHAALPDAKSGTELRDLIRSYVGDKGLDVVGSSANSFASAATALRKNKPIKYLGVAGGNPIIFDDNGDALYPVIAGTFVTNEQNKTVFLPTRVFFGDNSIDFCAPDLFGKSCIQGYTDSNIDPGQICVPPAANSPIPLGNCLPNCNDNNGMCPSSFFKCENHPKVGDVCIPQIPQ